jgi:hypothetical protein
VLAFPLHAMLLFYPGGVKNIERDYPGIANAINSNFVGTR